jgi:1-deoxy-D-xylulose-5-phosphate synthase
MLSHIPNLIYLAPTTYEELIAMEAWAIRQEKRSVAIRVPEWGVLHTDQEVDKDYDEINKFKLDHLGSRVAIIAVGDFYQKGLKVKQLLAARGIDATLINPRYLSGVDEQMLQSLESGHQVVATLEDGSLDGGFGERIARYYGPTAMRVINFGVRKALYDRYDVQQLMKDNHLLDEQIADDILAVLDKA